MGHLGKMDGFLYAKNSMEDGKYKSNKVFNKEPRSADLRRFFILP